MKRFLGDFMALQPHHIFKLVIGGPTDVGKTTFILRYTDKIFFAESKKTVGVDFALKKVAVNLTGKGAPIHQIAFQLWDFAGESRFEVILPYYIVGTHILILAFDCTRIETLEALPAWLKAMKKSISNIPIILISTKNDLGRIIPDEAIQEFMEKEEINYLFHTSSKTGENVEEVFQTCVDYVLGLLQ